VPNEFETWVRGEISRLQTEAEERFMMIDNLESTLDRWIEQDNRNDENEILELNDEDLEDLDDLEDSSPVTRSMLLLAVITSSGSTGMTFDEIIAAVAQKGCVIGRHALRSWCSDQCQRGNLVRLVPGRFAGGEHKDELIKLSDVIVYRGRVIRPRVVVALAAVLAAGGYEVMSWNIAKHSKGLIPKKLVPVWLKEEAQRGWLLTRSRTDKAPGRAGASLWTITHEGRRLVHKHIDSALKQMKEVASLSNGTTTAANI
jgi:hypothetical protein